MLTEHEIDTLVEKIVARMEPERVVLFGSYAKGRATNRSDLDLLLVRETDLPMERRADPVRSLLRSCIVPVDVHILTPEEVREYAKEELGFVYSILRWGRTIYERPAVPGPA